MTSSFEQLREALESLRTTPKSLTRTAEQYDELLLELDSVPEAAWNFIKAVFSDESFLKRRGLDNFLMEMHVDLPKYSARQLQEFLQILMSHALHMTDNAARHAVGDFIARAYPSDVAMKALKRLANGCPRDKQVAFVGLDVLRHKADPELLRRVLALRSHLLASQEEWFHKV